MECVYKGKKISGILGVLPEETSNFEDELDNYSFPHKQSLRLKRLMGYDKHRLAKKKSTASDFCVYGLKYLLSEGKIRKEDIGAIFVVTLSPDYFVPHISNIIHGGVPFESRCTLYGHFSRMCRISARSDAGFYGIGFYER